MHWPLALQPEVPSDGSLPVGPKKDSKTGKPLVDLENSNDNAACWAAMEALVEEGLVKSIGISNFNIRRTRQLLKTAKIKPVANQVELSFTCPQPELVAWLKKKDILPQAYSLLGSTGAKQASLEVVERMAKKYGCEGANVLISWQVARGACALPKSVTPSRIANNLKLVDLSKEDVQVLEEEAIKQPFKKTCDQTDSFEPRWDIYEMEHPENNDKVQCKKD